MWSEKKLYLTGAVAILAFSVASMSAASANPSYSRSLLALLRFFRGMIADVRPLCV